MQRDIESGVKRVEPAHLAEQPQLPQYPFKEYPPSPSSPFTNAEIVDELFGMKSSIARILRSTQSPENKGVRYLRIASHALPHYLTKVKAQSWGYKPELSRVFYDKSAIKAVINIFHARVALLANQHLGDQWIVTPLFDGYYYEFFIAKRM